MNKWWQVRRVSECKMCGAELEGLDDWFCSRECREQYQEMFLGKDERV